MNKKDIRRQITLRKREMTMEEIEEKSRELSRRFLACEPYKKANTVYGYLPFNQEVRVQEILLRAMADGKRVALPKITDGKMRFIYITDLSAVRTGYGGAPEPIADGPVAEDPGALVLVPGLAFDERGRRLGYGGGFYDRFLSEQTRHPTVGLCYAFQIVPDMETETHDRCVDQVIWV